MLPFEDLNNNFKCDPGEDVNGDGVASRGEDVNGDGILRSGPPFEDINWDGKRQMPGGPSPEGEIRYFTRSDSSGNKNDSIWNDLNNNQYYDPWEPLLDPTYLHCYYDFLAGRATVG